MFKAPPDETIYSKTIYKDSKLNDEIGRLPTRVLRWLLKKHFQDESKQKKILQR